MHWVDEGFLLSKNNFDENSIIIEVFTLSHGKCSGIVYGGSSRKQKRSFQIGNKILLNWKSKNIFRQNGELVFLICTPHYINPTIHQSVTKDIKELSRSFYGIGFHSMHSTDTLDENLLLYDNFILGSSQDLKGATFLFEAQTKLLNYDQKQFIDALIQKDISWRERTIISGGLALSLMGIRETKDIDLITDLKYKGHEIDIHNC